MEFDVRITLNPRSYRNVQIGRIEEAIIHQIVADVPGVESAVLLRNNGFGTLMPDEDTRQSR